LKNLRVGGGVNVFAPRLIGNRVNLPFDYIYANSYELYSALVGYRFNVKKVPVDVQVNISNLLDYDKPVFNGVTVYQNVAYRGAFYYVAPLAATFTANIRF
jgi:outer membrane receptor for monomeric catechols